jgi:DNA-binding transcriptional regulator YiaG
MIFVEIGEIRAYLDQMSPEQCRAARGWLGWSQVELASKANVSLSTVRDFEKGRHTPIAATLAAMRTAIEAGGIRLDFDAAGTPTGITAGRDT